MENRAVRFEIPDSFFGGLFSPDFLVFVGGAEIGNLENIRIEAPGEWPSKCRSDPYVKGLLEELVPISGPGPAPPEWQARPP